MNKPTERDIALANLVSSIKPDSGSMPGTASFTDSLTAKVEYGKDKSNLDCIYSLFEALHKAGAVDEIKIDINEAKGIYNFDMDLRVADNASVGINPSGNLVASIRFHDPESIAPQLEKAKAVVRWEEAWKREDAALEKTRPFFGDRKMDARFVSDFLSRQALLTFNSPIRVEFGEASRRIGNARFFDYPAIRIVVEKTPQNDTGAFKNSLKRIFPGIDAVQEHDLSDKDVAIIVTGNPSRLVQDILHCDPANFWSFKRS